jgi:ABC-2 type transport system ATP-binding protein
LLERLNLWEFRQLLARDHSRGMQQKLSLARALLHEPTLLILDEPVSGLDPHGIRQVRELLQEENRRGVSIFVSSHILSEVERTAHRVGILHGGRLVAEDSVATIAARLQPEGLVTVEVESITPALVEQLRAAPFVVSCELEPNTGDPSRGRLRLRLHAGADHRRDLSAVITGQGGLITGMRQEQLSLEEAFVRLTTDNIETVTGRRSTPVAPTGPMTTPGRHTARRGRGR